MQVRGMGTALGPQYNGALHALVAIVKNEGIAGLYRGIWANLCEYLVRNGSRGTGDAESDLALFPSESRAEHRHLVLHVRAREREDSRWAVIFLPSI